MSSPDGAPKEASLALCQQQATIRGVFLVLEDEFGLVNVVVKPDIYERERSLVRAEPFILVRGDL